VPKPTQNHNGRRLRFAVVCGGLTLKAWQARCLTELLASQAAELALLILVEHARSAVEAHAPPRPLLFRLFERWLHARSQELVDITQLALDTPRLQFAADARPRPLSRAEVNQVAAYNLDFILQFSDEDVGRRLLGTARYGVWSFYYGDIEKYQTKLPCFWEIYKRDPVTSVVLWRLTETPLAGVVLKEGFFATDLTSYGRNIDAAFFNSAVFPALVCQDVRSGLHGSFDNQPAKVRGTSYVVPTNLQMLRFAVKTLVARLVSQYKDWFERTDWNIGVAEQPVAAFLDSSRRPNVSWLRLGSRGQCFADPFSLIKDGQAYVFCEQFGHRSKGELCWFEVDRLQRSAPIGGAINEPFHMSYPQVFEHEGRIYCLPETGAASEVRLYEAVDFPSRWVKAATLIEGFAAIDSTLWRQDGRWWLFCTDLERGHELWLCIWHATALLGPWQPHAGNPVKIDVRSARPAGPLFTADGMLYRPSQDCSRTYGGAVVLNRVLRLSTSEFKEEQVATVQPFTQGGFRHGIHTLSSLGELSLIDGKRFTLDPRLACDRLSFSIRKMLERAGGPASSVDWLRTRLRR
jgi:hypothetical protein